MEEVLVSSFTEFHDVINRNKKKWSGWFYRGQSKESYKLVPKVGRPPYLTKYKNDRALFDAWYRHAVGIQDFSTFSQWESLAIAQHHGLATRLLDWTFNPLNALYFALYGLEVNISTESNCVVYAHYSVTEFIDLDLEPSPFEIARIRRVRPNTVSPRIAEQGGIFTVHGTPNLCLEDNLELGDELVKIIITKESKLELAKELSHYGVNSMGLFPDLDGLSSHINWTFVNL